MTDRRVSDRAGRVALQAALALAVALVAAAPLTAAPAGSHPEGTQAPAAEVRVVHVPQPEAAPGLGEAGLQVVRDPESGELRAPTGSEAAAFAGKPEDRGLLGDGVGLQAVTLPSGAILVDLQGRLLTLATATVTADGAVATSCSGEAASHPTMPAPEVR